MKKLPLSFYRRPAPEVAPELLGKVLTRRSDEGIASGRIVEVEAYGGCDDAASHAYTGIRPRNEVMFGPAGRVYVYFIYGMYHCVNAVTGQNGEGEACLIRALEPARGIDLMIRRRGLNEMRKLTNGPGKICTALHIDRSLNGRLLTSSEIFISDDGYVPRRIERSQRIGIGKAKEKLWRFYIEDNPYVS